jgi:hypothetical protein
MRPVTRVARSRLALLAAALGGAGCAPTTPPTLSVAPSCGAPGDAIMVQYPGNGCSPAQVYVFPTPSMAGDEETPATVTNEQDTSLVFTIPVVRPGNYVVALRCPDGEGLGSGTHHPLVVPCPSTDGGADEPTADASTDGGADEATPDATAD